MRSRRSGERREKKRVQGDPRGTRGPAPRGKLSIGGLLGGTQPAGRGLGKRRGAGGARRGPGGPPHGGSSALGSCWGAASLLRRVLENQTQARAKGKVRKAVYLAP